LTNISIFNGIEKNFGRFLIKKLLGTGKMDARQERDPTIKKNVISPFSVSIS